MNLTTKKYGAIKIHRSDIGGGGEGKIYPVASPSRLTNYVVKVYDPKNQKHDKEQKLQFMIKNPVQLKDAYSVIWPNDVVYDNNGKFIGYLMLRTDGEPLDKFLNFKLPRNINPGYSKFDLSATNSMEARLKIVYNLSAALSQVHSSHNFVFGDLKSANVMLKNNSTVSIIDMDSIQVAQNGKILFPSPVATLEYLPAEAYQQNRKNTVPVTYDLFAMGVMFYWLMLGQHPAMGTYKSPYDKDTDIAYGIKNGLYACVNSKQKYLMDTPSLQLHQKLLMLPQEVQNLFVKCFDQGQANPSVRPTAREWCIAVKDVLTNQPAQVQKPLFPKIAVTYGKAVFHEPPEIISFSASKHNIVEGDKIQFTWSAATYIKLQLIYGDRTYDVTGKFSRTIKPKKPATCKLVATNRFERVENSIPIKVYPKPFIKSFRASKKNIIKGDAVTLSWVIANAQKAILQGNGRKIDVTGRTQIKLKVQSNINFSLIVLRVNPDSSETKSLTVNAYPKVIVREFACDKEKIVMGARANISWSVTGAQEVQIQPLGNVNTCGTQADLPCQTTKYILTANNPACVVKKELAIVVYPNPEISCFSPSKDKILKGEQTVLKWKTKNADMAYLSDGKRKWQAVGNELVVSPATTNTYTLEAHSKESIKIIRKKFTVEVFQSVQIDDFRAENDMPFTVTGVPIIIEFGSTGATKLTLHPGNIDVTGKKYFEVTPEEPSNYKLVAENPCDKKEQSMHIDVFRIPEPDDVEINFPEMKLDLFPLMLQKGFAEKLNIMFNKLKT